MAHELWPDAGGGRTPVLLNSWKEIAAYLGRGVRTVQRWEQDLHLPVHRIGKGKRSPVYSTVRELNFWISTTGVVRPKQMMPETAPTRDSRPIEESRRLMSNFHTLVQSLAENSVRHQQQAEILQSQILKIRSQIK